MLSGTGRALMASVSIRTRDIMPPSVKFYGWGWGDVVARDRNGELWVATGQGVVRWNASLTRVVDIYDSRKGLGGDDVFRVWMDSRGDLWFSTFGDHVLTRRDHATGTFTVYGERDGGARHPGDPDLKARLAKYGSR